MSLESKIEILTQAVVALTAKLESANAAPSASVKNEAPQLSAAPLEQTVTVSVLTPPPFATAAAKPGAPFVDGKGLIDYVMASYKALGPQKGAQIQNVLTSLGYQNINDVKPEHYDSLFASVESLKAA